MGDIGSRAMAIDLGERRIGIAMSDPTRFLASAFGTLASAGRRKDASALATIARENDVDTIVLGLPLTMRGEEGPQAEKVRQFGEFLATFTNAALVYLDERLTTVQASRYMRETGKSDRTGIDAIAAEVLLQSFLDSRRTP